MNCPIDNLCVYWDSNSPLPTGKHWFSSLQTIILFIQIIQLQTSISRIQFVGKVSRTTLRGYWWLELSNFLSFNYWKINWTLYTFKTKPNQNLKKNDPINPLKISLAFILTMNPKIILKIERGDSFCRNFRTRFFVTASMKKFCMIQFAPLMMFKKMK